MCIIVVKKAGIAAPSDEMFENMWNHNPDGAGFMYTANGGVCIEKGFMEYKDFYKAYKRVEGKIDTVQTPMIFHFRITTHGGTSPENTHPFPVTDNLSMLRKLMCKTSLGVAHNGILSVQPRSGVSDTMEYILTQLSTMSETDRQTVCQKLDVILQEGTAEQQSLYLDAVQTMAWCSHSFDGAQREAYDYFLEHSARSSQAAYRAQAVMDALTGGGAVQMRLEPADGVRGGDYTVGVSDGSGAVRAQGFSGSFYWATASDSDPSGSSITLQSPDGRCTITAWENSSIVRCEEPGETAWLMAASTSSAPYDGNTVFTYLRKWYDEAEFNALVDRLIVPADGRNREELAQSWLDAVGDVTIHQVTPGSKYENSFVQNRVTVESAEPAAGLYDPELLAGQHFTFTNERIFVPGNYRSKEQQTVNSSARAYHGEYGPMPGGGAFLDTRSGLLYQTADGWKGTFAP